MSLLSQNLGTIIVCIILVAVIGGIPQKVGLIGLHPFVDCHDLAKHTGTALLFDDVFPESCLQIG